MDDLSVRQLFNGQFRFVFGLTAPQQIPQSQTPSVVFAGRSNVGKSSLINTITGQKKLARTSLTPGRTQQINIFEIENKLQIIDFPGYGYAKVKKSLQSTWLPLIDTFLSNSRSIQRLFILIDSRHGFKEIDTKFMNFLDQIGLAYQIVFTKIDKIKRDDFSSLSKQVQESTIKHPAMIEDIIFTSTKKLQGIQKLKEIITSLSSTNLIEN